MGKKREKVVSLQIEMQKLRLVDHPYSFCFLLRSMFEISCKAYCEDHKADGLITTKPDGTDRRLVDVLRDITNHLTKNKIDKKRTKELHGALTELASSEGILSVTSMNALVHHPTFSIAPKDISRLFFNVFPLLKAMNE